MVSAPARRQQVKCALSALGQRTRVRQSCRAQVAAPGRHRHRTDRSGQAVYGRDESFNGKFRDECLSMEWFRSRAEAMVVIEQWRQHYNVDRPHSSLGYLTPLTFK